MKTILKIIIISILLSSFTVWAQSGNLILDFDPLKNANTIKKRDFYKALDNLTVKEMQSLLDQNFDVNREYYGATLFSIIVGKGITDVVAFLIKSGADIHARGAGGGSPLHYAASNNHPEIIQLLIDAGIDIDVKDKYGKTSLYDAANYGRVDAARKLLQLGADPNPRSKKHGSTAFIVAVEISSYPNVEYYTAEDRASDKAKGITRLTILELLIEYGADPHAVDNKGNNARAYIDSEGGINANIVRGYLDELGVK